MLIRANVVSLIRLQRNLAKRPATPAALRQSAEQYEEGVVGQLAVSKNWLTPMKNGKSAAGCRKSRSHGKGPMTGMAFQAFPIWFSLI